MFVRIMWDVFTMLLQLWKMFPKTIFVDRRILLWTSQASCFETNFIFANWTRPAWSIVIYTYLTRPTWSIWCTGVALAMLGWFVGWWFVDEPALLWPCACNIFANMLVYELGMYWRCLIWRCHTNVFVIHWCSLTIFHWCFWRCFGNILMMF